MGRKSFGPTISAGIGICAAASADHRGLNVATRHLQPICREEIRHFGSKLGIVELGLGESADHRAHHWNSICLAPIYCDPPQPAALVVLLMADRDADRHFDFLSPALGD